MELPNTDPSPEEPTRRHEAIRNGRAQQQRVRAQVRQSDAYAFFNRLTGPESSDKAGSVWSRHRERKFPPSETLSMFLSQALSADRSCQKVVDEAAIKRPAAGLTPCRTHTVRLVDGTTVTMADPPANQTACPQPRRQQPGLGFPPCRMAGLACLGSGAVLDAAIGRYQGKGGDEPSLLRSILGTLKRGDWLPGDAFCATHLRLCPWRERGIEAVFEQHGSRQRTTDFRRGQRLGGRDHPIVLTKPVVKPDRMSQADYEQAPQSLTVRELPTGGKTLVTTLLCPKHTATKPPCARFIAAAGISNSIYAASGPRWEWND